MAVLDISKSYGRTSLLNVKRYEKSFIFPKSLLVCPSIDIYTIEHRAVWSKLLLTTEIFMVNGQTMVKLGFRQLSKLMLRLGSNPKHEFFIFVRLMIRITPVQKFWRNSCPLFYYRMFYPKKCDYF